MLSPRANTGTNWPPPPFFSPVSPSLYLCLHICVFLSLPLVIGADSFPTKSPLSFSLHIPALISHSFSTPPTPHILLLSLLFAWCSAGEPQGREIIQTLCILQALWSAEGPRCSDTLVYLDWPSKQPTPWQIARMLHAQTHTHTRKKREREDMQNTHSAVCSPESMHACRASSFKEIFNQKKERGGKKNKTNESGKGARERK